MVTKQEFSRAYRVSRRWMTVATLGLTALWFYVFLTVGLKFKAWFDAHDVANLLWIAIALVLFATGVLCMAKIIYKHYGLVCPSCGDWIASQDRMLSTGKCPRCKTEMFCDDKQPMS